VGLYTVTILDITDDTDKLKKEVFYIDNELASKDILGIVDLIYNSNTGHLYGNTEQYDIRFSRKETIWKYFIVKKKRGDQIPADPIVIEDLDIIDNGSAVDGTTNFTRQSDDSDHDENINGEDVESDSDHVISINDLDAVVFKSDDPIPFLEIPKTEIQLISNSEEPTILINHLPNPSHSGTVKDREGTLESEIYVFI
jgi:hypothetical protein